MKKLVIIYLAYLSINYANANIGVPEGFEYFFSKHVQDVHVIIAGESHGEFISSTVNYEEVIIPKNTQEYEKISTFFKLKGVKSSYIIDILEDLNLGITTDPFCEKRLENCVLDTSDGVVKYVFDFDNSTLRVFLPVGAIRKNISEESYESPISKENGVINWSSIYGYSNGDGQEYLTFSNETVVGLKLGQLSIDTEYTTNDDEFEVFTALYDLELDGVRAQIGRNKYNSSFNSTDYLNNGASYAGDNFSVASSRNLLVGDYKSQQRIYFYAPQNGQLEIYRDDRIILNKVFSEGRQSISYSELPKGAYTITLVFKVSGNVVLEETQQVVNNNQFSLKTGAIDYVVSVGQFYNKYDYFSDYDRQYTRGLVNYRWTEKVLIGAGLTLSKNDQYYQIGSNYIYNDYANFEYTGGYSNEGDVYQIARASLGPIFFDFQKLSLNKSKSEFRLVNQIYAIDSYENIGLGVSGSIFNGNGYLRYSKYSNEDSYNNVNFYQDSNTSRVYSAGWTYQLPRGSLNLSGDYTTYENDADYDDLRFVVSYTIELGEGYSGQISIYSDENGFDNNTNYLRVNSNFDDWDAYTSVGATFNRNNEVSADISTSITGTTERINANAYGYLNDSGNKNLSIGLTNTQVISSKGIGFTSEKARSFARVNKSYNGKDKRERPVELITSHDSTRIQRSTLTEESTFVKLDEYSKVDIEVDKNSSNVDIEGGILNSFSYPGSVFTLDVEIVELLSRIVVLDDIDGEPIANIQCVGEGCVNIEPLSGDGVFRINYKRNKPYKLISERGVCFLDEDSKDTYIFGHCLPSVDSDGSG